MFSIDEDDIQLLPLSLHVPASLHVPPSSSASDVLADDGEFPNPAIPAKQRAGRRVSSLISPSQSTHRYRRHRGVMFFLPAFSTSIGGVVLPDKHPGSRPPLTLWLLSQRSFYWPDKYPPLANLKAHPDVELIPFGGFLFGSHVMVAKEAHTSPFVKDLIVAAAGVDDSQWEGTYVKDTGGIITVRSELGEPIHKVNTSCSQALKGVRRYRVQTSLQETWCLTPGSSCGGHSEAQCGSFQAMVSDEEVACVDNRDYGCRDLRDREDGRFVEGLGDIRLCFASCDLSLRNLMENRLRHVEDRFAGVNGSGRKASKLQPQKISSHDGAALGAWG
jgi:hypothetical protein